MAQATAPRTKIEGVTRLARERKFEQALKRCQKLVRQYPGDVNLLGLLASLYRDNGKPQQAEKTLLKAISLAPDYSRPYEELGLLYLHHGHLPRAVGQLEKAIQLAPRDAAPRLLLARAMEGLDQLERAIDLYRDALRLSPARPEILLRLASVLAALGRAGEAAQAYADCLVREPDNIAARIGLGNMQKTLGEQEAAIASYREVQRRHPDNGAAYHSLANLKTFRFDNELIEALDAQLARDDLHPRSRVNMLFARASAYEQSGDFDSAWNCLAEGNALQKQQEPFDIQDAMAAVDRVIEIFDTELLSARRSSGDPGEVPIFIVGMPRSGSTLVEQILASHSQVEGTSELPFLDRITRTLRDDSGAVYPAVVAGLSDEAFDELGREYLQMTLPHRPEKARHFTDKMPNNFSAIGMIHLMLPQAKIIDVRRGAMDTCVANLRHLYARSQAFAYSQSDVGGFYLQYQRMMDHWDRVLPGRVMRLNYEELVMDTEAQVRRLLEHIGLPWEQQCLEFHSTNRAVHTASSEQVRQPVYQSAIGFWRNYEKHLGELKSVLGDQVDT